jgi:hypothetical protein
MGLRTAGFFTRLRLIRFLRVVLLAVARLAVAVRFVLQFRALLLRDHAVGLGFLFVGLLLGLAFFETRRFLGRQFAGFNALLDALFLVRLAFVDVRCRGLGVCAAGENLCDCNCGSLGVEHGALLGVYGALDVAHTSENVRLNCEVDT